MYGSVLSGGLAGHVHGTAAYDVTSTGEASGWRPFIWEALRYRSAAYMQHLRDFVLCEGARYQELVPATDDLKPRASASAAAEGLDGWSYLMRTPDRRFALAYFEWKSTPPAIAGMEAGAHYRWTLFDPQTGRWSKPVAIAADAHGMLKAPTLPDALRDWVAKLVAR